MGKKEKNTTSFGAATITWLIDSESPKINTVYKRMRSVVKLMDQVTSYEELYNVLKLLRPKNYFHIVEVSLTGGKIEMRLEIFENGEQNDDQ